MRRTSWLPGSAAVLLLFACAASTRAAPDTFGLGDGHSGNLTVNNGNSPLTINDYTLVTADAIAGATTITVNTVTNFGNGDLVLVWQATGLNPPPASGMAGPFDLTASPVGRWELARLSGANNNTLTLAAPLVNTYDQNVTQVVRVPEYKSVTINANGVLTGATWNANNGNVGGIVAFLAQGTVTNGGTITTDGIGFRGGTATDDQTGAGGCNVLDGPAPKVARKGEGITTRYGASQAGLGNVANGAGGGDCVNAGGGGGGNGGAGGKGGRSIPNDGSRDVGGLGGGALTYSLLDHLTFGGGGGAGHGDSMQATSGAAGGGAIFIRGAALAGNGAITANGASAMSTMLDGAGGGGAGGSIYLRFSGAVACGSISAKGGDGGSTGIAGDNHGPGGGGAGGRILLQGSMLKCTTQVQNGVAGTSTDVQPFGANYGATPTTNNDVTARGVNEPPPIGGGFCAMDAQCAKPTPRCLVALGTCVACASGADCGGNTPVCDTSTHVCRACAADGDCGGNTPACQTAGKNAGTCGQCSMTNAKLCTAQTPVCDLPNGVCRACGSDTDCGGNTPACQTAGTNKGGCGQCSMTNTALCIGPNPVCSPNGLCVVCVPGQPAPTCATDANGHVCVNGGNSVFCGCGVDADCGANNSGRVCDAQMHKCVNGCSPAPNRNHCPANQFCTSTDLTGMTTGTCSTSCVGDGDCKAPTPLCLVQQGGNTCVACRADADCAGNPNGLKLCAPDTHSCVACLPGKTAACTAAGTGAACLPTHFCGCTGDGDCGTNDSGRVCNATSMMCEPGCRPGGNGCPPGQTCGMADGGGALGTCNPLVALPDGGSVGLTGGGFCNVSREQGRPGLGSLALLAVLSALVVRRRRSR